MRSLYAAGLAYAVVLSWPSPAGAACTGAGDAWNCPTQSTESDVQAAVDAAPDGATVTFAAGSYSWSTAIDLSNDKGVSLVCQSGGICAVEVAAGTIIQLNGTLSGTNTHLYRVSGFVFQNAPPGALAIWFWGPGTLTKVRVDHNTFEDFGDAAIAVAFGESGTVGSYYGVIDHNNVFGASNFLLLHVFGGRNDSPPASPKGTADNMFVEDNKIDFTSMTNSGAGCADAWGGASIVWRHNATTNCLVTSHGVAHNGGPFNYELYGNAFVANFGATGVEDCYRCFHHQGSGEFIAFDNAFSAVSGKTGTAISMTHYRSADPVVAGYDDPPGRCDGTKSIDGNRTPNATFRGYPCWRQPGRDGAGNLQPMYVWNNHWSDTGGKIDMVVENPWGATAPSVEDHVVEGRDYYNAVSASTQTSPTNPFDGTRGMGFGALANRPPTCTTNDAEPGGGVGYFAMDDGPQGTLYRCSATNAWTVQYRPYMYPHPLVSGTTPPAVDGGAPGGDGGSSGTGGASAGAGGAAGSGSGATSNGGRPNGAGSSPADGGSGASSSDASIGAAAASPAESSGCGCRVERNERPAAPWFVLASLGLVAMRRRR